MSYWSGVTRNLIMRNSAPLQQHGGNLGTTTWSYVVGKDGVKTIDPIVGFYLSPPPKSRCRWSTNNGLYPPNHIVISDGDADEGALPPRELVDWNDDTIQAKVEQYRQLYWEDLKYLIRPNTFEDLYELFDSATLWYHGAYNLWKLVNALITLAHDQFPHVCLDWKNHIEKVVYDIFRPVSGAHLVRGAPNHNMQVLCNQQVLIEWDHRVDPLALLQMTTFPAGDLALMSVQQQGLLRELLICEHIRLSGTQSPIPQYYNYPRPVIAPTPAPAPIPIPDFVDKQSQLASVNDATPNGLGDTATQVASVNPPVQKSRMPFVVVGTNNSQGQLKVHPRDLDPLDKKTIISDTVGQPPVATSPSTAPLPSIPEEFAAVKIGKTTIPATIDTGVSVLKVGPGSPDTKFLFSESAKKEATPVEYKPTGAESPIESDTPEIVTEVAVPMREAQSSDVQAPVAKIVTKEPILVTDANLIGVDAPVVNIVTEKATPPPGGPIRDRKDSNGSTDKLFYPEAPSDKLYVGRQHSVASAPDQDTESMLTFAEKYTRNISETPPAMQVHCDQQWYAFHSASDASLANNPTRQGSDRFHGPEERNQSGQQSRFMGHQMQPGPGPQHGRDIGPPATHPSQVKTHFGPPNGTMRGPEMFVPNPNSLQTGPNNIIPHCGPPANAMSMGLPMRPPFQNQMPPHADQQFGPYGPPMNTSPSPMAPQNHCPPGYQPNGYIYQPQHYGSHGEQGVSRHNVNDHRASNNNGGLSNQYKGKRRDVIQSTGYRKTRMNFPGAVNTMPRQGSTGLSGRRSSNVGRFDENRGKGGLMNCKNERDLPCEEFLNTHFVECSCARCQESSRSVFVNLGPQGKTCNGDLQHALLEHFSQFSPVSAKIRRLNYKLNCLIEFRNDVDMARIIHWSCDPENQIVAGVIGRVQAWYPFYSKHYVPRQCYGTQDRHQSYPLPEHSRGESNPFCDQQPVEIMGMNNEYDRAVSQQHKVPDPHVSVTSAPRFLPSNGLIYQQVQPQNQPRVLFNPAAPQGLDSRLQSPETPARKTEQKLIIKTTYSQDVRRSQIMAEESWRQLQVTPPSKDLTLEGDNDAVDAVKDTLRIRSVKSLRVSLPTQESSAREAVPLAASRSGSPEVDDKTQDKVQTKQPQKERPQSQGLEKEQCPKAVSLKNKPQKDKVKKERMPTDDSRSTDKIGDKSVASSSIVMPDTNKPAQESEVSADEPRAANKGGEKSDARSCNTMPETGKLGQHERAYTDKARVSDEDDETSTASSRTVTPELTRPVQNEIALHHNKYPLKNEGVARKSVGERQSKQSCKKDEQSDVLGKQNHFTQMATDLSVSNESLEAEMATNVALTGGYSKTTSPISSAVGNVGYSTDTVIRHKPGRPAIPTKWTDAEADDELPIRTPSQSEGMNTTSAILNRINDVDRHMTTFQLKSTPAEGLLQDPMSNAVGYATGDALVANEASASSAIYEPNKTSATNKDHVTAVTESTTDIPQKPKPSRSQRNKKNKKKVQCAGSKLTSRSHTSTDSRSRDPSPASDRPHSAAVATNASHSRGPSPAMKDNKAPSDGIQQPRKTCNKQPKNKWKQMSPSTETSEGLAQGGESQVLMEQRIHLSTALQKPETSQEKSDEKSAHVAFKTSNNTQNKPAGDLEKSGTGNSRSRNDGGSLRMPKNRVPKKCNQKNGPQGSTKDQAPTLSGVPTHPAVFEPSIQEDRDVCAEASLCADQRITIDQTNKSSPPEMRLEKFDPQISPLTPANNDCRVALPKVALPFPRVGPSIEPSGYWASVARSGASHSPQPDMKNNGGHSAPEKDQVTFGDFNKKNVMSPQKSKANDEKENVPSDKASPTSSPEEDVRRSNTMTKSWLNATVQPFSPSRSCTSSPALTKPKLNPTAAAFSLPPSPLPSVAPDVAPSHGRTAGKVTVMNTKENEKPNAHDHTAGIGKRFVTPAEQTLDTNKVTQPPRPSKENKRAASTLGRSGGTSWSAMSTAETIDPFTSDPGAKPLSTPLQKVHNNHSDVELETLNKEMIPAMDQAAVGPMKKRRAASIVKADLPAAVVVAPSGNLDGRDINVSSPTSAPNQTQQSGAKSNQTHTQRVFTISVPLVPEAPQAEAERKQKNPQEPGDKDNWHTVRPKQKNNGGVNKGYGNRARGSRKALGGQGGRRGRDGAMEERKGG